MNTKTSKILKIVGIIFLVCVIVFVAIFATIKILKKEKVCAEIFEDSFSNQIETKTDVLTSSATTEINFTDQVALLTNLNSNLNARFNYIMPNFYYVGLNSFERKDVSKIVKEIDNSVANLERDYTNLENLYKESQNTTEITNFFKKYCSSYSNLLTAKANLLEKLEASLQKHKIEITPFAKYIFKDSDLTTQVALKFNIPYLCNSAKINETCEMVTNFLGNLNEAFENFQNQTSINLPNNYVKKINSFKNYVSNFETKFIEANNALNQLNEKEIQTLLVAGNNNYSDTPSNKNLKAIYDFLKTNGTLRSSLQNQLFDIF